jgi:hypothetical protein
MKVVYKKPRISHFNLKLYKGIKHMELIRIYPKTRIKSDVSEVKVKISAKKYSKPRTENISYNMKVYFSETLLKELGWSNHLYIAPNRNAHNENEYVFQIVNDGRGFKLNSYKNVNHISFTINKNIEKYNEILKVEHRIDNGNLIITL